MSAQQITSLETTIAKKLFKRMWSEIQRPDGTADGGRVVAVIATMLATAAITVRDESNMCETIDLIATQAKTWADRAPVEW